ncbi:MAG: C4-type zinc ribbon domain-containing protein [Rikenellaceae bacterium]
MAKIENTKKSAEETIIALYNLQKVRSKIDEINRIKGELPYEVQDLSDELEGLRTRLNTLISRVDEISKLTKSNKVFIEECKESIKKYQEQQENVRNNREYDAISKEVEYKELEILAYEKQIKAIVAESKEKKAKIEVSKMEIEDKEVALKEKQEELESIDRETAEEVSELEATASEIEPHIEDRLLAAFNKLRAGMNNGLAVVTIKRDACGGCFNRIPPQRQLDIHMSKSVIVCEYCGRILVSDLLDNPEQEQ